MRGSLTVVLGLLLTAGCVFDPSGLRVEGDGPGGDGAGRDLVHPPDVSGDADLLEARSPDAPLDGTGRDSLTADGPGLDQPILSDGPTPADTLPWLDLTPSTDVTPSPDLAPTLDLAPTPDLGNCPSVCDVCDKTTATCTITETAWVKVTCPAGWHCKLTCTGTDACRSGVDCSQAASCDITCGGSGDDQCKSGAVICGPGYCKIACTGKDSCLAGLDCSQSCGCQIICSGGGSCSGTTQCPSSTSCCTSSTPCSCP